MTDKPMRSGGHLPATRADFWKLEDRFNGLENRFNGLEGRFDVLEGRFDVLEGRFDHLEGRFNNLESNQTRSMVMISQLVGTVHELKNYMVENTATKADINRMNGRMDSFAGQLQDFRRQWAYHSDALMQHERRISKLESERPS